MMGEVQRPQLAATTSEVAAGQVQRFVPKLKSWELLVDSLVPPAKPTTPYHPQTFTFSPPPKHGKKSIPFEQMLE